MMLNSVYAFVDLLWVKALGGDAVAALSISLPLFFVVLAFAQVVATTALSEISQAYGAGRPEAARGLMTSFTLVGLGVGLALMLTFYVLAEPIVGFLSDQPAVVELGLGYFEISAITFFTQLTMMILGNGLRGSGEFLHPMGIMAISVVVNVILDPILIFGWGPIEAMGLDGAAWATIASQCVALALYVVRLAGRPREARELRWGRPTRPRGFFRKIASVGLPAGIQFGLLFIVLTLVLVSVKPYGALWTAVAGAGFRVVQQLFLPIIALASASAAIAGQNIGARHADRVARCAHTAIRWSLYYGAGLTILLYAAAEGFALVFASSPEEIALGAVYFRWSAPVLLVFGLTYIPTFVLQAAGRAILPMTSASLRVVLLAIVLFAVIPAAGWPPEAVFGAVTATALFESGACFFLLQRFLSHIRGTFVPAVAASTGPKSR